MVNQKTLAAWERPVIVAKNAVNALHDAATAEVRDGGDPANADHWGTILLNLELLAACNEQAIVSVKKAKAAAESGT